jgi:hypothetical protein
MALYLPCGRLNDVLCKYVHILIHRTAGYIALPGKNNFVNVNIKNLEMRNYPVACS